MTDYPINPKEKELNGPENDLGHDSLERELALHQSHISSLYGRRPSRVDNDASLSGLHNKSVTANIRRALDPEVAEQYHDGISFNWSEFWKTMLYENLPPVLLSPLAALLIEKSPREAWHAIQHRGLLAVSTKYRPLGSLISFWLFIYPFYFIIFGALAVRLFGDSEALHNIDIFEIILASFFLFLRNVIISLKYAYMRSEDVAQLTKSPPHWDEDMTNRRLIFAGWRRPHTFKGLIEDELTVAMDENDVALQGMSFRFKPQVAHAMRNHPTNELFAAATRENGKQDVAAGFVLHQIIKSAYRMPFPSRYFMVVMFCPLLFASVPALTRWLYGLPIFGETGIEQFVFLGAFLGAASSMLLLIFGLISSHDFHRRENALRKLGELIQYPGIPLKNLLVPCDLPDDDNSQIPIQAPLDLSVGEQYAHIDLEEPDNIFAWYNCRKTLRAFGEPYYMRVQAYTSVLLTYAFSCMVVLNIIVWSAVRHHVSTIFYIFFVVLSIASIAFLSINRATRLQSLSQEHREYIKRMRFLQEKQLIEMAGSGSIDQDRIQRLKQSQSLLAHVDQDIHYLEEVYKPTTVMGRPATQQVFGSTLGVIVAGLNFAWGGFIGSEIIYDAFGWFSF